MSDLTAFLAARLDETEHTAHWSGPALVAWLTYRDDDGQMLYTTVAAGEEHVPWIADGHELPEPSSSSIVYDPARVLREVEAGRRILARYEDCLARMEDPDYPQGVAADQAREYEDFVLPNLAAAWSGHPDYDQEWNP